LLTPDVISVTDPDTDLEDLIITLEQEPRHGNVTKDGRRMTEGDQFTFDSLANSIMR